MRPLWPLRILSVSPSGNYRVVSQRFRNSANDYTNDFRISLLDRKGKTLLNIALTNQRSMDVLWRSDERALAVNNANANSGDYLVYAREVKPGSWSVLRVSSEDSPPQSQVKNPVDVLNPGLKKYWDLRCKIYSVGFRGDKVIVAVWLYATRRRRGKQEGAIDLRHYVVSDLVIAHFPPPHLVKSIEAAFHWE